MIMNKFEKQLEKWNGGTLRGAQAKLARILKVSTATVALWATGKRRPSKGYASKMADLFQLDIYGVLRLFDSSTTYPDVFRPVKATVLRDKENPDFAYFPPTQKAENKQNPRRALPVLTQAPQDAQHIPAVETQNYWELPPSSAHGAAYILALPPDDTLYFIKPETQLHPGKWMLLRVDNTPRVLHVCSVTPLRLQTESGEVFPPYTTLEVLGIAVQKITVLK